MGLTGVYELMLHLLPTMCGYIIRHSENMGQGVHPRHKKVDLIQQRCHLHVVNFYVVLGVNVCEDSVLHLLGKLGALNEPLSCHISADTTHACSRGNRCYVPGRGERVDISQVSGPGGQISDKEPPI